MMEKETGKQVAIKAVNIMKICELNKERHILREKELTVKLKHPSIVKLYNTFKDDTNLYFVFECCNNGSLDEIIRDAKGTMPIELVKTWFA